MNEKDVSDSVAAFAYATGRCPPRVLSGVVEGVGGSKVPALD